MTELSLGFVDRARGVENVLEKTKALALTAGTVL